MNITGPILLHLLEITSGAGENITAEEGQSKDISCEPKEKGTMIIWFRVLDKSGIEFIASFSRNGKVVKTTTSSYSSLFRHTDSRPHIITLQSFNKERDSGVYSCGSLYGGNELKFSKVTRLVGSEFCFINLV